MIRNLKPYWEVLRNWNFTKLWASQLCSQLTNYLLSFVILIQAYRLTDSSLAVSVILLSFGLATVVFGSLAGVYADRFDRRHILMVTTFLRGAAVLFYIPFNDNLIALAIITFIYSSLNQFYLPAEAPSIPNLVPKRDLLVANSYFGLTANSSMIIGFALAGPVSLAFGQISIYLMAAGLLFLASLSVSTLPALKPEPHPLEKHFVKEVWKDFKAGLVHLKATKNLHFSFFSLISAQIYNGLVITLAPEYIQKVLNITLETGTFVMIAPLAFGVVVGSLFIGWEGQIIERRRLVKYGFVGIGIFTLAIALLVGADRLWLYFILAFLLGISNSHIFAPSHSIIQDEAHEHWRGRFYATLFILLQAAATLPTIIVGVLSEFVEITSILAGLGLLILVLGLVLKPKIYPSTAKI